MSLTPQKASKPAKPVKAKKASAPRPDEMSPDVCEFLAAVDDFKRSQMRSFLSFEDIHCVLELLGYERKGKRGGPDALASAIDSYKRAYDRLFPTWSEIFVIACQAGWRRPL